jgi:hypothetical protein
MRRFIEADRHFEFRHCEEASPTKQSNAGVHRLPWIASLRSQ